MNKEQQKFYLRGYAKGRAFQKKQEFKARQEYLELSTVDDIEVPAYTMFPWGNRDNKSVSIFQKAFTFFRNGLSL